MSKKRIIIGILIALLLIAGIGVNIIAMQGRKEINEKQQNSTNAVQNVDNTSKKEDTKNAVKDEVTNNEENNENIMTEEELELTGDKYNPSDVIDKDGNTVTLETEENKPMVILYWNTENEGSIEALEVLQSFYDKYQEKVNFVSMAVVNNYEEEKSNVETVLTDKNINMPAYYDAVDGSCANANNVSNIPTLLVVNKNAEVINKIVDEVPKSADAVEANLDIITENF